MKLTRLISLKPSMLGKVFIFIMASTIASLGYAGDWVRISTTAISFSGHIEKDELSRFLKVYKPTDETLTLNSAGGHMGAALDIGSLLIKNKNLSVVVHGLCASSCANYLFLAGHTKKIDHGIVGFHGNWKAMVATDKFKMEAWSIAPAQRYDILDYHQQKVRQESDFFSRAGVDQSLFDKTQKENDEGLYDIYVPGPNIFEKYGIHDVIGAQDKSVMKEWAGAKVLFDSGPSAQVKDALPTANTTSSSAGVR